MKSKKTVRITRWAMALAVVALCLACNGDDESTSVARRIEGNWEIVSYTETSNTCGATLRFWPDIIYVTQAGGGRVSIDYSAGPARCDLLDDDSFKCNFEPEEDVITIRLFQDGRFYGDTLEIHTLLKFSDSSRALKCDIESQLIYRRIT